MEVTPEVTPEVTMEVTMEVKWLLNVLTGGQICKKLQEMLRLKETDSFRLNIAFFRIFRIFRGSK
jgi:hypothetical protein